MMQDESAHSFTAASTRGHAPPPVFTAVLLEYLEGDGGVLDGHNDPAVVQVQNVMLLLKNLQTGGHPPGAELCGFNMERSGIKTCQPTCLQLLPQSELMYISSLYSTSLEPRFPEGRQTCDQARNQQQQYQKVSYLRMEHQDRH